jgi:hypothetical protein
LKVGRNEERKRKKREKIYEVRLTSCLGSTAFPFLEKHSTSKHELAPNENDDDTRKREREREREREIRAIFLCYKSYLLICIH